MGLKVNDKIELMIDGAMADAYIDAIRQTHNQSYGETTVWLVVAKTNVIIPVPVTDQLVENCSPKELAKILSEQAF